MKNTPWSFIDVPGHPTQHPDTHPGAVGATAVLGLLAAVLVAARPRRLVVDGRSMVPTLQPGDHLLALRTVAPRPGDLVVVRDPRLPSRLLVKRVVTLTKVEVTVAGDNPGASTDSRHFGPVPRSGVVGRVRYRYGPPARTGWIGRFRSPTVP